MSDMGNAHPSEAFRTGRWMKSTGWIQCGQDLIHEKDAQHSPKDQKDGTEMMGLRAQTMRDAQEWGLRQGNLGQWREMKGHPSLVKGFSSAGTNQAALGKQTVIHSTESSHKRKERQQNPMHRVTTWLKLNIIFVH